MSIKQNPELLNGLQTRVSFPRLTEPAPSKSQLAECYKAAFRSPDHGWMRPWRFIECRGQELNQLGELVGGAMIEHNPELDEATINRMVAGPLRAPLVIIAYAKIADNPKVPNAEQLLAAGCAANNLITALYASGFGAVWRTGDPAHSSSVHKALGLVENETIIGFLYIGTPLQDAKAIPVLDVGDFVTTLSKQLA